MKKLIFFSLVVSLHASAQNTFEKRFTLFNNPQITFIQPLKNGGYILCGSSDNLADSSKDFCFLNLDDFGDIIRATQIAETSIENGNASNDFASTIREKSDGSFIFGGMVKNPSYSDGVAYYGAIDQAGNLTPLFHESTTWNTSVNSLLLNSNDEIISTRDDNEGAGHHQQVFEIHSTSGQILSTHSTGNYSAAMQGITELKNEGYAVLSMKDFYNGSGKESRYRISTTDHWGNITGVYDMQFPVMNGNPFYTSLCATSDSGVMLCGTDAGNHLLLTKISSVGDSLWSRSINMIGGGPKAMQLTGDGGFAILLGYNSQMSLLKLNSGCDSMWTRTYGDVNENTNPVYFQETNDNGFCIVAGIQGAGAQNIYVVKTDENGLVSNTITKTGKADPVKFNLYPDPFSSSIHLRFTVTEKGEFILRDISGRAVYREIFSGDEITFSPQELPDGIYAATVANEKYSFTRMIVKN